MNYVTDTNKSPHSMPPQPVEGLADLEELSLDLRWSWNHAADHLWRQLDSELWELTHNPCAVLQTVSRRTLQSALADPKFRQELDHLLQAKRQSAGTPAWFQRKYPGSELKCIAYFSMEFMLSEALPIYSGGLGNVAGDQLKAASDLGVPVLGIGLLYQQGYFRQMIDRSGAQQALFPYNDPGQLPITPVRQADGQWLRLEVKLPGYSMWLRTWQVQVGRCKLYLLDSNDPANYPAHRGITSELYGGGPELRLRQEIVLGIAGWRLLEKLGLRPQVCHLNEGHAALAVLERARCFMAETGQPFNVALAATRVGNLFTTHTAVPAGFDRFAPGLIEQYLGHYAQTLGLSLHDLLALGRVNAEDASESFNMAYLAVRGSGAVNGVSQLHGQVSRQLFAPLFPRWPADEVPVGHVTNGVHMPSWDSAVADDLWTRAAGKERWLGINDTVEKNIRQISDADLWQMRSKARNELIVYARHRLAAELALSGEPTSVVDSASHLFDPNVLTIGFARRFATYKRPNLLLHDVQRLLRLLTDPLRPVQLILAGKAHPADLAGQEMIQQWIQFAHQPQARPHVMFLSDYDMLLAERLVQGVDVWLNTPRRPWEASGTSGMKILVNGGLNVSELDGWWAEAYAPEIGWSIGDGQEHYDDPATDAAEANQLYELLEREVVPSFYDRTTHEIPASWLGRVRESMARLTPQFSADRTVREYTERHYLPASVLSKERASDQGAPTARLVRSLHALKEQWSNIRFGAVQIVTSNGEYQFEVTLSLGHIDPNWVRVEIYANGINGSIAIRQEVVQVGKVSEHIDTFLYRSYVPASRAPSDFTLRVVPRLPAVEIPLECSEILWQR